MRILHVNQSDRHGGAAIAARRVIQAQHDAGMDVRMLVLDRTGDEDWVIAAPSHVRWRARIARGVAKRVLAAGAASHRDAFRTMALLPTGLGAAIRREAPDIVNFHWVGSECISLKEIASTGKPTVWSCHDEWAWCGAEHYATDDRFRDGYAGTDIDAKVFARKRKAWRDFHPVLVGSSHWIAARGRESILQGGNRVETIHTTLDATIFSPVERAQARAALGLPDDGRQIVLFGAQGGGADPRKGFDLLVDALQRIPADKAANMRLVSFGGREARDYEIAGLSAREIGQVREEAMLARLYNAADVFVAPSRMDNLPNTLLEALACGTPCIAFDTTGLPDLVFSPVVGELVPAFDCGLLADAIVTRLAAGSDRDAIRAAFLDKFGPEEVARRYTALYEEVLRQHVL